ncbi:hypothetical protein EAI6_21290 [Enterobacter asburiae]|nr:hypothetical protein EAI6_21290 [Enterobacter asburiae]
MYKLAIRVQIISPRSQRIARINKKLSFEPMDGFRKIPDVNLVNSRYNYGAVAQKKRSYVKKGKKKTECGASGSIRDKQTFKTE